MGNVYWGLHAPLASALGAKFDIRLAIETGTYYGGGALQLAGIFDQVITIEHDPELHKFNVDTFGMIKKIQFMLGDSRGVFNQILPDIAEACLIVLDAHWFPTSPRSGYRQEVQCPVIGEINAIKKHLRTRRQSAIIIDDASMFLGSLKRPFDAAQFPSIVDVIRELSEAMPDSFIDVLDDVIVAAPKECIEVIHSYKLMREKVGGPAS